MNYPTHFSVVRDAWNLLKYYVLQDPEDHGIPKKQVKDALSYFYDLRTVGWKVHGPTEFSDPSGNSLLKDKERYVNRNRTQAEPVYAPKPPNIYASVANVDASFNPKKVHPDQVGCILGHHAGHVDDLQDTWVIHFLMEILDIAVDSVIDSVNTAADAVNLGAEKALAPVYALVWGLCRLFGGCKDWPSPGDVIPDIPDIPDVEFPWGEGPYTEVHGNNVTRFWHFINMVPLTLPGLAGNHGMFDDHDGYYYPHGIWSLEEVGLDVGSVALQTHLMPDHANDPCSGDATGPMRNYQIDIVHSDDDHRPTLYRPSMLYAAPTLLSVVFNPVDNMAKYGWDRWRQTGDIFDLGYVLHPIVDAATAHHTADTMFRNHVDYEDYVQDRYDPTAKQTPYILNQDKADYTGIWKDVGTYMGTVNAYWASKPSRKKRGDLPIRNMLTKLAKSVWNHSLKHDLYDVSPDQTKWAAHARYALKQAIAVTAIVLSYAPVAHPKK